MGIIIRQSYYNIIISMIGVAIGYLNMALLMPRFFEPEYVGLVNTLLGASVIFSTFARFGLPNIIVRYFPYFRDQEKHHHGFFTIILLLSIGGSVLFSLLYLLFNDEILAYYQSNSPLFVEYGYLVVPLTISLLLFDSLWSYSRAVYKTVVPNFIREVVLRIFVLAAILLFHFELLSFEEFLIAYIGCFAILVLIISGYLSYLKLFFLTFSIHFKIAFRQMIVYGFFALMGGAALIIVNNIDKLMVASYLGLADTGVYSVAYLFAVVIYIPSRVMAMIVAPVVAESIKKDDLEHVGEIYTKSSITLLIAGLLFFALIFCNSQNLFQFLPQEYGTGTMVVFYIGLAKVFDLMTGINGIIIVNSKLYKIDFYTGILLVTLTVITNMLLIPALGINGAAIATMISIVTVNSIRWYIVWKKMSLNPFTGHTLIALGIGTVVFLIGIWLPKFSNVYVDLIYRSSVITILFISMIYFTGVSQDINDFIKSTLKKLT